MNQKKSATLYGSLLCPLAVGHCALIRYQGQMMRTSQVVAIHNCTADAILRRGTPTTRCCWARPSRRWPSILC